jgi:hypothetical protein
MSMIENYNARLVKLLGSENERLNTSGTKKISKNAQKTNASSAGTVGNNNPG